MTKRFTKGQKVRTIWGTIVTVMEHRDTTVYIYEECGGWYHETKVFANRGVTQMRSTDPKAERIARAIKRNVDEWTRDKVTYSRMYARNERLLHRAELAGVDDEVVEMIKPRVVVAK